MRILGVVIVLGGLVCGPAFAGQGAAPASDGSGSSAALEASTSVIDGSPAPLAPASITRDDRRRPTVRAIKLTEEFVLDGRLDERVYQENEPFGDFIQVVPQNGALASERTDVWITYDDRNIYIAARVHDSAPPDEWVANEYRRDTNQLRNNDQIGVGFDTFYDRRSGFMFYANPLGGFSDYSVVDEGAPNTDWNPVWRVRTGRFEGGWTVEMAIPFRSIRYTSGTNMTWGFQMRRAIRRKNEWAYLTRYRRTWAAPWRSTVCRRTGPWWAWTCRRHRATWS